MVSMSKDHSTLSPNYHHTDTLISSTTETLLSRYQMEETLKSGTSINNHSPSEQSITTNHGTLRTPEIPTTCKYGAPTPTGGKSSSMKVNTSSTGRTEKLLMYMEEKTKKEDQLSSGANTVEPTRDGRSSILIKLQRLQRKD